MGTNYYLRPPGACPERCDNWVHLGKASAGWTFTFAASATVTDYPSWLEQLDKGEIYDEYGYHITRDQLLRRIELKRGGHSELHANMYYDAGHNVFVRGEFS